MLFVKLAGNDLRPRHQHRLSGGRGDWADKAEKEGRSNVLGQVGTCRHFRQGIEIVASIQGERVLLILLEVFKIAFFPFPNMDHPAGGIGEQI